MKIKDIWELPIKKDWNRYDRNSRTRGYEMGYAQAIDEIGDIEVDIDKLRELLKEI